MKTRGNYDFRLFGFLRVRRTCSRVILGQCDKFYRAWNHWPFGKCWQLGKWFGIGRESSGKGIYLFMVFRGVERVVWLSVDPIQK